MEIPKYGRTGFLKCFEFLNRDSVIVEIGMQRRFNGDVSDGCSTSIFSWFIKENGGILYSVDIIDDYIISNIINLKEMGLFSENINLICDDGINFFDKFDKYNNNIDLIYLDAWDYSGSEEDKSNSEKNHLLCFLKAEKFLNDDSIIIIDDINNSDTYEGKGRLLIPYLLSHNYTIVSKGDWKGNDGDIVYNDWQYIFRKNNFDVSFSDKLYIKSNLKNYENCKIYIRNPITKQIISHDIKSLDIDIFWWFTFESIDEINDVLVEIYDNNDKKIYKKIIKK
jgi:hypothetical protein